MNNNLVDLEKLRNSKSKAKFHGKSGFCFVKGNKLIKIYNNKDTWEEEAFDGSMVCDFSKFKADTIVFPIEYIYENGVICGEIQKYINDKSILTSLNDKTNILPLIKNYELVIEDIITYSNILMHDLCSVNILYSEKNGFHLIDTSEWEFSPNSEGKNIYSLNSYIVKRIFDCIDLPIIFYKNHPLIARNIKENVSKFGNIGERFYKIFELNMNDRYRLLELLYAYIELYNKIYCKEMNSFSEMKELTKILKKG